jgi:hypothetical protein
MEKINDIQKEIILIHLNRCFKIYGIGGTEDKIKEIYKNLPKIKQAYLKLYWEKVRG